MTSGIVVVVVPLVMQGHLNAFLHLARRIAAHGIPVHYVSSSTHVRQAKDRTHQADDSLSGIHFHDFPLPPFVTPPPDATSTMPFPSHLQPAFNAALHLKSPISALLHSLSPSFYRLILIHDSGTSFAADAASSLPNVETYVLHTVSAIMTAVAQWEARGKPPEPWVQALGLAELSIEDWVSDEFSNFIRCQHVFTSTAVGRIVNSCISIEKPFLDQLRQEPRWHGQTIFAVGPLNPVQRIINSRQHECLQWLDEQPPGSVVYVAFGTTTSFTKEQVGEIEAGLKSSGQRFLWVCRDADLGDIYARDDKYNEVEKCGVGMIVRGWAPQLEILSHPSMAAFMSHCGWNSCLESLSMGVPILAWPMHSDQPWNAVLVTEILRAGMLVRDWKKRNELVTAEMVKDSVSQMVVGEEGKKIRETAAEIREGLRQALSEGGSSKVEFDSFIAHITRS